MPLERYRTIRIKVVHREREGEDLVRFARALRDHIWATFNEDDSIETLTIEPQR